MDTLGTSICRFCPIFGGRNVLLMQGTNSLSIVGRVRVSVIGGSAVLKLKIEREEVVECTSICCRLFPGDRDGEWVDTSTIEVLWNTGS